MKRIFKTRASILDNIYSRFKKMPPFKKGMICIVCLIIIVFASIFLSKQSGALEHFSFPFLATPHLKDGDKIYVKTIDGKYVTSCRNCEPNDANIYNRCKKTLCIRDEPYLNSQFTYHKHRDGTFSLETQEGKYWKRCAECVSLCPNVICSDGINPNLQTHKFVLIKNQRGQHAVDPEEKNSVSIKTDNGRLIEVTDCNQTCGKIITALGLNATSRFIIEVIPSEVIPLSQQEKKLTFDHLLPQEFPKQLPYSQG